MSNELRVLQHCTKSKFIVELEDYFEEDGKVYLIKKHISKNLRDFVKRSKKHDGPLTED